MLNLLWVPATMSFMIEALGKHETACPAQFTHLLDTFFLLWHPTPSPNCRRRRAWTRTAYALWSTGSWAGLPRETSSQYSFNLILLKPVDFSEYLHHTAISIKVSRATVKGLINEPLELISGCPSAVLLYWSLGCTYIRQSWYMKIRCPCLPSLQMKSTRRA